MSQFEPRRISSRRSEIVAEANGEVGVGAVGFPIGGGDREVVDLGKAQRTTNEVEFAVCAFDPKALLVVKKWRKVERATLMAAYRRGGSGGGRSVVFDVL